MRFFHTFIGSFYSADTYRTVRNSPGNGLAYSFLLVILTSLVTIGIIATVVHIAFFTSLHGAKPLFDDVVTQVADQLPVMTLKSDRLVTRDAQKYTINLEMKAGTESYKGAFATIDTTGATTHENMKTPVLLTGKEVIIRNDQKKETTIKTYSEILNGRQPTLLINRAMAQESGQQLIAFVHSHLWEFYFFLGVVMIIPIVLVFYVLRLCLLVVLGVGGILLGQCFSSPVTFDMGMRLAAVSYTPVILVAGVMLLATGHMVGTAWLVICGLIMLAAAIAVTRETPLADAA